MAASVAQINNCHLSQSNVSVCSYDGFCGSWNLFTYFWYAFLSYTGFFFVIPVLSTW